MNPWTIFGTVLMAPLGLIFALSGFYLAMTFVITRIRNRLWLELLFGLIVASFFIGMIVTLATG